MNLKTPDFSLKSNWTTSSIKSEINFSFFIAYLLFEKEKIDSCLQLIPFLVSSLNIHEYLLCHDDAIVCCSVKRYYLVINPAVYRDMQFLGI